MRPASITGATLTFARRDPTFAVLLAAVVLVASVADGSSWWEGLGAAAVCVPLAWRTRDPAAVLAAVVFGVVLFLVFAGATPAVVPPVLVALYTVAAHGSRRRTLAIAAGLPPFAIALVLAVPFDEGTVFSQVLQVITQLGIALAVGEAVRNQRALMGAMRERAERAERDRELEAGRRVDEERMRIARDVHDVVAHSIATITTQASVGVHVGREDPARAVELLEGIKDVSGRALHDLRHALGVLRDPTGSGALSSPTPSLDDLPGLVRQARDSGLLVTLRTEGAPSALPTAVQVAIYRIVQESLTNVMRHAAGAQAEVGVAISAGTVVLDVIDDGAGAPTAASDAGARAGLVGMRERAHALGGTLETGRTADGGFAVRAVLPLDEEAA